MSEEAVKPNPYSVTATVTRVDGTLKGKYDKPKLDIYGSNAIISFLLDTKIAGVVFKGIDIELQKQSGSPEAEMAPDFKILSIEDYVIQVQDSDKGAKGSEYYVTLTIFDPQKKTDVTIDPQIINRG
jgi:hypothetical protein